MGSQDWRVEEEEEMQKAAAPAWGGSIGDGEETHYHNQDRHPPASLCLRPPSLFPSAKSVQVKNEHRWPPQDDSLKTRKNKDKV